MTLLQKLKAALAAATIMYAGIVKAEEPKQVTLGYNALEIAATEPGDFRTRLLTNVDIILAGMDLGYHGLNEATASGYSFGRHVLTAGKPNSKTRFATVIKTTQDGVLDTKAGIRDEHLPAALKGYGYLDATLDENGANVTFFYGKGLRKRTSAEVFQSIEFPFGGSPSHYVEFQVNRILSKHASAFVRAEIPGFDTEKATYLGGIAIKF